MSYEQKARDFDGIDFTEIGRQADQEIAELKALLEPFKDLVLIEPQPDWDYPDEPMYDGPLLQDTIGQEPFKEWCGGHNQCIEAPLEFYHPVKIANLWYWSL